MKLSNLFCGLFLILSSFAFSIEKKSKTVPSYLKEIDRNLTIQKDSQNNLTGESSRFRLPISITSYKRIETRGPDGMNKISFMANQPLQNNLKARLDRPNHFYINEWHIETRPLNWQARGKTLKVRVSLFHRYGEHADLEEAIGYYDVVGKIVGNYSPYMFYGHRIVEVKTKDNMPLAKLEIGLPVKYKDDKISKLDTKK